MISMSRLALMIAAALATAAAQPAVAAPAARDALAIAPEEAAWMTALQQGKGQGGGQGGGGQEERGGRGQGGGGQEARESRGRSGGGEARPARQSGEGRGQAARGSGERRERSGNASAGRSSGNGGSASSNSGRSSGSGNGSGSANERAKGNSSGGAARSESRGNAGNADARRGEGSSNASSSAGERRNENAGSNRASGARGPHRLSGSDLQSRIAALPAAQRRLATSTRAAERVAVGAIARGHARGLAADAFDVRSDNDRVRILNRAGALLFDMDDRRAGELGGWQLRRLGDQAPRANAPAFCRGGEGHPVQGRQWCIDKGFGLGSRQGTIWSRGGIGDIIFRNPDTRTRLDRGGLIGVLGDIVLGRLALQAVSLGYDQPLTGYWVAQPEGPRLLRVRSGEYEVAEFHDADRDNRVEVLYVVQPVW
jgi:hypothetical protein